MNIIKIKYIKALKEDILIKFLFLVNIKFLIF